MPRQLRWAPKSSNQNPGSTLQLTKRDTQKGQVSALGGKHSERKFRLEMQQEEETAISNMTVVLILVVVVINTSKHTKGFESV